MLKILIAEQHNRIFRRYQDAGYADFHQKLAKMHYSVLHNHLVFGINRDHATLYHKRHTAQEVMASHYALE
jgi:hypothetical protein